MCRSQSLTSSASHPLTKIPRPLLGHAAAAGHDGSSALAGSRVPSGGHNVGTLRRCPPCPCLSSFASLPHQPGPLPPLQPVVRADLVGMGKATRMCCRSGRRCGLSLLSTPWIRRLMACPCLDLGPCCLPCRRSTRCPRRSGVAVAGRRRRLPRRGPAPVRVLVAGSSVSCREAIDNAVEELQEYAGVRRQESRSVISLTGNAQMSSFILEKALSVLRRINVNVQKSLQDPFKVAHVSVVVPDSVAEDCVQALRSEFHDKVHGAEKDPAVSSSGLKRKAVGEGVRPERAESTGPSGNVVVQTAVSGNDPLPAMAAGVPEDDNDYVSWMRQVEADGARGLAERTGTNPIILEEMERMLLSNNDRLEFMATEIEGWLAQGIVPA